MIVTRGSLMGMIGVSVLTSALLLFALLGRKALLNLPPVPAEKDVTLNQAPVANAEAKVDYSPIAAQDLFAAARGVKEVVKQPDVVPEPAKVELNMLGAYPNEWPRLKLTGVFSVGTKYGAVISGGTAQPSTTGDKYDSIYFEGDQINGNIYLGPVSRDSVVLRCDKNGWTIFIGVDPPAQVKK